MESGTLEDDQNRRDFTINALAISLNKPDYGTLIDRCGIADLGRANHPDPLAPAQTFSDDPLRMMRAIRFASQLGFQYRTKKPGEAIAESAKRISIVSGERIADELNKILLSKNHRWDLISCTKRVAADPSFPQMVGLPGPSTLMAGA